MTGLVLVADPPSREHLRFRCRSPARHSRAALLGPPRAGKCSPVFAGGVRNGVRPRKNRPRCPDDDRRIIPRAAGRAAAGGESRAARPAGRRRHRQPVRRPKSCTSPGSTRPAAATGSRVTQWQRSPTPRMRFWKRRFATKAQRSATAPTATPSTSRRLPESPPRLRPSREPCPRCAARRLSESCKPSGATFFCAKCQKKIVGDSLPSPAGFGPPENRCSKACCFVTRKGTARGASHSIIFTELCTRRGFRSNDGRRWLLRAHSPDGRKDLSWNRTLSTSNGVASRFKSTCDYSNRAGESLAARNFSRLPVVPPSGQGHRRMLPPGRVWAKG